VSCAPTVARMSPKSLRVNIHAKLPEWRVRQLRRHVCCVSAVGELNRKGLQLEIGHYQCIVAN